MSGLFTRGEVGDNHGEKPRCESLYVGDARYTNSAAKFWPGVVDEVEALYPARSSVELRLLSGEPLTRKHLRPEDVFREDLERLLSGDERRTMQEMAAELAIVGPPSTVHARVVRGDRELFSGDLPADVVDADIFPCLQVWLLEWAGIPHTEWNREQVAGRMIGIDKVRRRVYALSFECHNRHVAEGLYERTIVLESRVESLGHGARQPDRRSRGGRTMSLEEIKLESLDAEAFIEEQCSELVTAVGDGTAVNALSGGVDSSVVTMLGHRALGNKLKTYFIDNGLMRENEPEDVVGAFKDLGVTVELVDAREEFLQALAGITDPEQKRQAITDTFYKSVFGRLVKESEARYLMQGTIFTDVEETVAGIKRQHNILSQLGIDTEAAYGYTVLEPLIRLRKPAVRAVGRALGLPEEITERPPFPGPALTARIVGEATRERIELVRGATVVVEDVLKDSGAFQVMAVLHEDRVTGIRDGKRDFGLQIEVRCWDSKDAVTATPTRLSFDVLEQLSQRLTVEVPGVVSVTYNITSKPPSTMEVV